MSKKRPSRRSGPPSVFRMPLGQTPKGRKSTITNAFVNAVIPAIAPSIEEIAEALQVLGQDAADLRCSYCGDPATEWDHLRPLVINRRPTGFISEIANLVPACNKCNQSKRNKHWRDWMLNKGAPRSPASRGIADIPERINALERFESWRSATKIDFATIVGEAEWEAYWGLCDAVNEELKQAELVANDLRARIISAIKRTGGSDANSDNSKPDE